MDEVTAKRLRVLLSDHSADAALRLLLDDAAKSDAALADAWDAEADADASAEAEAALRLELAAAADAAALEDDAAALDEVTERRLEVRLADHAADAAARLDALEADASDAA